MEAARQLQSNLAAEAAVITSISQMYGAVVTPHQNVCGDLAAWPQVVYMSRLVRYLGALRISCQHAHAECCGSKWAVSACADATSDPIGGTSFMCHCRV